MMYAYKNPERLQSDDDWIQWVFWLGRADKRHAVEFVEGGIQHASLSPAPSLGSALVSWAPSRRPSEATLGRPFPLRALY